MTLDDLRALADKFFVWQEGSGRQTVTTFSALLFAQHVLKLREKSLGTENSAGMDALRNAAQRQLDALGGYRREIGLARGVPDEQPCDAEVAARAALEQQAEPAQEPEPQTCTWQQDGDSGVYGTSCRRYFNLEDGTPEDNKMAWCCYCGKKLVQQAEPTGKDSLPVESVVAENATTQQQIEQTPPSDYRRGYWDGFNIGKREGRIEAEDELAQQAEPEPVAWMCPEDPERETAFQWQAGHCDNCGKQRIPLYTAPPQRKPLTEEQIEVAAKSVPAAVCELMHGHEITVEKFRAALAEFARAIEHAHGIGEEE